MWLIFKRSAVFFGQSKQGLILHDAPQLKGARHSLLCLMSSPVFSFAWEGRLRFDRVIQKKIIDVTIDDSQLMIQNDGAYLWLVSVGPRQNRTLPWASPESWKWDVPWPPPVGQAVALLTVDLLSESSEKSELAAQLLGFSWRACRWSFLPCRIKSEGQVDSLGTSGKLPYLQLGFKKPMAARG